MDLDVVEQGLVVQGSGTCNAERAYATFIFSKIALMWKKRSSSSCAWMGEVVRAGAIIYACELCA